MGLAGCRILVVGAETGPGKELARHLAARGAQVALVTTSPGAEAALQVQRLARRLAQEYGIRPLAQAIDVHNDMAVRVMVRQMAKAMGGLDLAFLCPSPEDARGQDALALLVRHATREMKRHGGGGVVGLGHLDASPVEGEARSNGCWAAVAPPEGGAEGAIALVCRMSSSAQCC